jgi:hypothetical protein
MTTPPSFKSVFVAAIFASFAVLVASGCHSDDSNHKAPGAPPVLARGDSVVVERAAADFFEGRILSATESRLKVQMASEGDPVDVARSDAYRLPVPLHDFHASDPAICRTADATWSACRVTGVGDPRTVTLLSGEVRSLRAGDVLAPTEVTALGIRRAFDVADTRRRFVDQAERAGEPARPHGWTPGRKEPVLARRELGWYAAHSLGAGPDGGVVVSWDSEDIPVAIPGGHVVPVPPFEHTFVVGEFVLTRPASMSEAWEVVRITGVGADEASVVGQTGESRRAPLNQLVPLTHGAPSER